MSRSKSNQAYSIAVNLYQPYFTENRWSTYKEDLATVRVPCH